MLLRCLGALGGLAAVAALLPGQPPAKPPAEPPAKSAPPTSAPGPLSSFKGSRLSADPPIDKDFREYAKMVRGSDDPAQNLQIPPRRRKELFEKIPRYLIYRLTWENVHEGLDKLKPHHLLEGGGPGEYGIFEAFPYLLTFNKSSEDPDENAKRERLHKYMAEFREASAGPLREVLKNRLLAARLNAAMVLHRFTEYGQEDTADELLVILDNPNEHDAVKHWAIKGLGELFAFAAARPPKATKDPKRLDRCALAVYQWLDDHSKTPASLLAELSEPEKDGIRYIRKEAIRTLGNYRRPALADDPKANHREGPVAELLLRIMNNEVNEVAPRANWPEREAAAVALCQLQAKYSPSYQPEFAAYQVCRFIAALGAEATKDGGRTTQRWQFYAADLKAGTDALAAELKGSPSAAYFSRLMDRVNPVLENLYDNMKFQNAVADLNETLNNSRPKATGVFQGPMEKK